MATKSNRFLKALEKVLQSIKKMPPVALVFIITVIMCICFTFIALELVDALRWVPDK